MTFSQSLDAFYERFGPQSAIVSEVSYPAKLVFLERQFGLYVSWLKDLYPDKK